MESEPLDLEIVTTGLQFPEGPIACADGSVLLVEIKRGTLTRVQPDGTQEIVAETGGGPNGAAIGPDGACYVCNNGGFVWTEVGGLLIPGEQPPDYSGGRIERIDLATGAVTVLYTECEGRPLRGPNDLVFDQSGGFWFSDLGKSRAREKDRTGIFYALPDGSSIREMAFPLDGGPNGIGLSPAEDRVYVAETETGRVTYWDLDGPGQIRPNPLSPHGGTILAGLPGMQLLDSLAVDAEGNVCVATLLNGGVTVFTPEGEHWHLATDDLMTTNLCFGGSDRRTAWITLSSTGRLAKTTWATPGLELAFGV